jgi:adenylate cyclase
MGTIRFVNTEDCLLERERKGLLVAMAVRAGFLPVVLLLVIIHYSAVPIIIAASAAFGLAIASAVFLGVMLIKRRMRRLVGIISLAADSLVLWVLPVIWYLIPGMKDQSPAFLTHTPLVFFALLFIFLNIFSLRPLQPLFMALSAVLLHAGVLIFALVDERTTALRSITGSSAPDSILIDEYAIRIGVLIIAGCVASILIIFIYSSVREASVIEKRNLQLGRYFSPAAIRRLGHSPEFILRPGGSSAKVTVLFADILSFSPLCETHLADTLFGILSEYHELMVQNIFLHNGMLDKFIGDGVMAVFGVPEQSDDDIVNAVEAAVGMRNAIRELNESHRAQGLPELTVGIGIHTGQAIAGNIGTSHRLDYTVLGNTVGIAARVAAGCELTGKDLLVTKSVVEMIRDSYTFSKAGSFVYKGNGETVTLYAVE